MTSSYILQKSNLSPKAIKIVFAGITKIELADTSQRVKLKLSNVELVALVKFYLIYVEVEL